MPTYKQDMKATTGNMGGSTDDNENKGGSGKVKRQGKRATRRTERESNREERKNLLTENPVVNRSEETTGTEPTHPLKRHIQQKISPLDNKSVGNNKMMNAMLQSKIPPGLSATPVRATPDLDDTTIPDNFKPSERTIALSDAHDEKN